MKKTSELGLPVFVPGARVAKLEIALNSFSTPEPTFHHVSELRIEKPDMRRREELWGRECVELGTN